ncbi:MAG: S9 family peptidase [Candidatus Aminicenantes bacterium]|nr:S9 family peptidase [Candidatus Aminicenantes bacterium]
MERNIRTLVGAFMISGLFCAFIAAPAAAAGQKASVASSGAAKRVPTVEDLMALKSAGGARISPDGTRVAFTVTETDIEQDAYVTQIWLADVATGESRQLTRGKKSSSGPAWSPDGRSLAFTSSRADDKSQLFVISPDGGEAVQLTKSETGVGGFAWSPDGKTIAFTAADPVSKESKDRKDYYGDYEVIRREYTHTHLWTVDVAEALSAPRTGQRRTSGKAFTVGGFDWSPDGTKISFSAALNPDLINGGTSDIYVLDLAGDTVKRIVAQPGPDSSPLWSPDGRSILFSTAGGKRDYFARNIGLALVPADGGPIRPLTGAFDENPGAVAWNADGIYFSGLQKTAAHLYRLDPESLQIARLSAPDDAIVSGFSFSRDGKRLAFTAASPTTLSEICVSEFPFKARALTRMTDQVEPFVLGTREVISWKSKDGAEIEGILIKPADFDPAKKYALLCVIHGGPTGVDRPALLSGDSRYYPSDIWAARGALVLKVNYRGSAGYGAKFRILNYRNLGVGDAWDVLSGVDHLVKKGWVDASRVGSMGWSQGGYISAFLTTSTRAFRAISVGAGISNWATYYYNTDITPFTINYLGDDPADDPAIYAKTSPMTYIKKAATPTLIQHGEFDKRVPIPNAYELRQGLEDRGVPVEMVVYKGYGHGITKPKSMRAVMEHNLAWFNHYIFGDTRPDLAAPPVPAKEEKKDDAARVKAARPAMPAY